MGLPLGYLVNLGERQAGDRGASQGANAFTDVKVRTAATYNAKQTQLRTHNLGSGVESRVLVGRDFGNRLVLRGGFAWHSNGLVQIQLAGWPL